jgi:hypothetical protein
LAAGPGRHRRTILLHAEQGLGDTLQFIRYAPLVQQRGGEVVVECQETLLPLLATCPGIDQLVARGAPLPAFDTHAPLLSLPGILGTTLTTIPANIPYLTADPGLREQWRHELSSLGDAAPLGDAGRRPAFKVGIAWQGNPQYPNDRQRSIPLARFAPLAQLTGVRLFSVQKGPGSEQLVRGANPFPVIDLGSRFGNFADTAAALVNLDLVVAVDSAVAHCAGALGLPAWVLLPSPSEWRWLRHREDSPWYPTMRLFRQKEPGDWEEVVDRLAGALTALLSVEGRG